jgi:L-amino acid N-acyltransferase YncA
MVCFRGPGFRSIIIAMEIRLTEASDSGEVLSIYAEARRFMMAHGNPTQWTVGAPDEKSLARDLANKASFVVVDSGVIVGTFALYHDDKNYRLIQGQWLNDEPYAVIHRMASIKKGVGTFILSEICSENKSVRVDTHKDNIPMRNLLKKMGFSHCGTIRLLDKDNSSREAYMKVNSL